MICNEHHVGNGICSGCGVCAAQCPHNAISMTGTREGYYKSEVDEELCTNCRLCVRICPFDVSNIFTRRLEEQLYGGVEGIQYSQACGYYLDSFVGLSESHQRNSASGGLTTWLLEALLEQNIVDAVATVGHGDRPDRLFEFRMMETKEELRQAAGSVYYPVEISDMLRQIRASGKTVAVVGLPCYISAIRKASQYDRTLKQAVKLCIGLVCGYMASKRMVELVAYSHARRPEEVEYVRFRKKTGKGVNGNVFIRYTGGEERLSDWGDRESAFGLTFSKKVFSQLSCDCCDDIFARHADAVFMDTCGLPGYGDLSFIMGQMSAVIVRSPLVKQIMEKYRDAGALQLHPFPISQVAGTQAGRISFKYRQLPQRVVGYRERGLIDERIEPPFEVVPLSEPEREEVEKSKARNRLVEEFFQLEEKKEEDIKGLLSGLGQLY